MHKAHSMLGMQVYTMKWETKMDGLANILYGISESWTLVCDSQEFQLQTTQQCDATTWRPVCRSPLPLFSNNPPSWYLCMHMFDYKLCAFCFKQHTVTYSSAKKNVNWLPLLSAAFYRRFNVNDFSNGFTLSLLWLLQFSPSSCSMALLEN